VNLKNDRRYASAEEFEKVLREDGRQLRNFMLREGSTVAIPIVNVAIDVGDLWVFAGIGFTLLQVALIYATAREIADTRITLKAAKASGPEDWRAVYDLLSMRQLFTVPPGTHERERGIWRIAPKLLFFLPATAQFFGIIVGAHYAARGTGALTVVRATRFWEIAALALSLGLTAVSLKLDARFDLIWTTYRPQGSRPASDEPSHTA
jgi:hypothetical protein